VSRTNLIAAWTPSAVVRAQNPTNPLAGRAALPAAPLLHACRKNQPPGGILRDARDRGIVSQREALKPAARHGRQALHRRVGEAREHPRERSPAAPGTKVKPPRSPT